MKPLAPFHWIWYPPVIQSGLLENQPMWYVSFDFSPYVPYIFSEKLGIFQLAVWNHQASSFARCCFSTTGRWMWGSDLPTTSGPATGRVFFWGLNNQQKWRFHQQKYEQKYGDGSIPINTIFRGMNIHLPAILMFTRGTRFWHTAIWRC